jgi:hypothetical protein
MGVASPVIDAIRWQRAGMNSAIGSPLYARLLDVTLDDIARGGPCADVFEQTPECDPIADALALRFLGGVHRIVLQGAAPDLAKAFPSAGGVFAPDDATADPAAAFLATIADHRAEMVDALSFGVQTNEVGRCAALLVGFLAVAHECALPLRVLEVGTSAGLNLRWDHFHYEGGANDTTWGDPSAQLCVPDVYVEPRPPLAIDARVVERAGCDRSPIDPSTDAGRLTLRSFVWPDQDVRLAMLDAAIAVAASVPAQVEGSDAAEWVAARLQEPQHGVATVVFHSIVWQYLPVMTRERIVGTLARAGANASADAPIAWLRMEPGVDPAKAAELRLRVWPGGHDRLLATTGYHGRPVRYRLP